MDLSQEIYGDVKEALSSLAQQLGVGVETFWPEFVKVQVFYGASSLFIILLGFFFLWQTMKYLGKDPSRDEDIIKTAFFGVIAFLLLLTGFISFFVGGPKSSAPLGVCLFSPQYCAIKEVLSLVNQ